MFSGKGYPVLRIDHIDRSTRKERPDISAVASMIRWRLSFGAQEMCGVMMQFFAFSNGLSARIGSV